MQGRCMAIGGIQGTVMQSLSICSTVGSCGVHCFDITKGCQVGVVATASSTGFVTGV